MSLALALHLVLWAHVGYCGSNPSAYAATYSAAAQRLLEYQNEKASDPSFNLLPVAQDIGDLLGGVGQCETLVMEQST